MWCLYFYSGRTPAKVGQRLGLKKRPAFLYYGRSDRVVFLGVDLLAFEFDIFWSL